VSKLTGREREVLRHLADGPTNAEIVARRIAAYEAGFLSAR
jgi:DNA-binding CsgD family transcriptional regulator